MHRDVMDVCDGKVAASRLGISPISFFNQYVKKGRIERVRGQIPGVDAFRVSDVTALVLEKMGVKDPPAPAERRNDDTVTFTTRDAALMLNMPIHQARDLLAAWGCGISMDEVSDLIARRHQLRNLGKALSDCATRIRIKESPVPAVPEKVPSKHYTIAGIRFHDVAFVGEQCSVPQDQVLAVIQELSIVPTVVGTTQLLSDVQVQDIQNAIKKKQQPKPTPAPPAVSGPPTTTEALASLLVEQRRTNELLQKLVDLWSGGPRG